MGLGGQEEGWLMNQSGWRRGGGLKGVSRNYWYSNKSESEHSLRGLAHLGLKLSVCIIYI